MKFSVRMEMDNVWSRYREVESWEHLGSKRWFQLHLLL